MLLSNRITDCVELKSITVLICEDFRYFEVKLSLFYMTFVVKIRGNGMYLLTYAQICTGIEGNLAL